VYIPSRRYTPSISASPESDTTQPSVGEQEDELEDELEDQFSSDDELEDDENDELEELDELPTKQYSVVGTANPSPGFPLGMYNGSEGMLIGTAPRITRTSSIHPLNDIHCSPSLPIRKSDEGAGTATELT
jgi:hypothetical protein